MSIERFCDWIKDIDKLDSIEVFKIINDNSKRDEITKFFTYEDKMTELYNELESTTDQTAKSKIIKNIAMFYPLSSKLIVFLYKKGMKVEDKSMAYFINMVNDTEGFFKALKENISELKIEFDKNDIIKKIDSSIQKNEEDIAKIKKQCNELDNKNIENESLIQERDGLIVQRAQKEKDSNREKLEIEIRELKEDIERCENLLNNKSDERDNLRKELDKINIDTIEEEEKEAIKQLKKIWGKDEA